MDNQESSSPSEPTAETTPSETTPSEPTTEAFEAPAPPPEPTSETQTPAKPTRMWPASTVIAGAIALALFSGLIGGVIGFSSAHRQDQVGLVGYQRGLEQGQYGQQGPLSRNPELQQRLQQFRDDHPRFQGNTQGYGQGNGQGSTQGYGQQNQSPTG